MEGHARGRRMEVKHCVPRRHAYLELEDGPFFISWNWKMDLKDNIGEGEGR